MRTPAQHGTPVKLLIVLLLLAGAARAGRADQPAGALEVELEDLRPGLLAVYRSLHDKDGVLTRLDAKPAFSLGHSSLHPRLPPGPFEATWTGVLFLKETAPVSFDATLCGEVTMDVDGVTVLKGRGESESTRLGPREVLNRPIGFYRLKIQYRSLADLPARLQIGWQGPSFSREPLPAWQLKHLAGDLPPMWSQEQMIEQGRTAVGRFGCARCHGGAFPGVVEPPPGPSLADVGRRIQRPWLLAWLDDPVKVRREARMPALFGADRKGFVERWIIAEHLLGPDKRVAPVVRGDHRAGYRAFLGLGCATCHFIPDMDRAEQRDLDRIPLTNLTERLPAEDLAAFVSNPHGRYPDGRMPRLPVGPDTARDIAAYLLMWSKPTPNEAPPAQPPTADEINGVARRLGARGVAGAATALLREKGCAQCHPGLGAVIPTDVPLNVADDRKGCLAGQATPRFTLGEPTRQAIAAYRTVAAREKHPSPFANRQQLLERSGCVRCHQRDTDRPPPIEAIGSTFGGAFLQSLPFQRTPRLTYAHQKYTRAHLIAAVRESVSGLRPASYSYRMPAFGHDAEALVQALAEQDGELSAGAEPPSRLADDPTLGTVAGSSLIGFQGYACVSCHLWNGQNLSDPDPGAVGTELTRVLGRVRRDWFDRFLEDPARSHPNTPMPGIFFKGKPAMLTSVLDGDAARQKDALWSFLALGKDAPSPKPPPPLPVTAPTADEPPLIAQVPIRLPDGKPIESIAILFGSHDLFVYDIGTGNLHSGYTGARILRHSQGRLRWYTFSGTPIGTGYAATPALQLMGADKPEVPTDLILHGYDRLPDGVRLRRHARFPSGAVECVETLRLVTDAGQRLLLRELRFTGVPADRWLEVRNRIVDVSPDLLSLVGASRGATVDGVFQVTMLPDREQIVTARLRFGLPASQAPPAVARALLTEPSKIEGSLERPGYRAIAYPRPRTVAGDDLILPAALAVNPKDGRVFVSSLKVGEIFVLRDPSDDAKSARFDNYGHGLFQEALSMLADRDALYVLHRRNLTRISEPDGDRIAKRFDRVVALPHGIADSYDYAYGLVRDKSGAFVVSYAPYANTGLPGSGSAIRLLPSRKAQEVAFGFRNPIGWCAGPEGEVFYTDNQGEWVPTNKLCHVVEGRYYGYPNNAQRQHTTKPAGRTAVWVPYGWARSINGVTYDNTGGKFGPFNGQFFLAELMYGGAIVRASLEKVNGEYQGACFPFWGKGLLGPLCLAFDPKGRLFVGGITEPGWMAQPDRGALFRIDYTGQVPFEMQTIQVRPRGFRIVFTAPVSPETARQAAAYPIEYYRYEYSGAYGSPELDRTRLTIERVELSPDGRSVELTTGPLVKDRVYVFQPRGVRSVKGEALVHPLGAYTLNEVPPEQ